MTQALHFGGMDRPQSQCCAMHVDQDGGQGVHLNIILQYMHVDLGQAVSTASILMGMNYHQGES